MHPGTDAVREVMLFDPAFQVAVSALEGRAARHAVVISNLNR